MTVHRIKLTDFKDKKRDEGSIEIETDDGQLFRVDPPEVWSDDVMQLAQDNDNIGAARLLIGGAEQYDAFVAAGGSAALVMGVIAEIHGATVPELRASSSS